MDINISTTAQNQKELLFLIKALKIPIHKIKNLYLG
jgi:ribosomal protein L5